MRSASSSPAAVAVAVYLLLVASLEAAGGRPEALALPAAATAALAAGAEWLGIPLLVASAMHIALGGGLGLALSLPASAAYPLLLKPPRGRRGRPPLGSASWRGAAGLLPFAPAAILGLGALASYGAAWLSLALAVAAASLRLERVEVRVPLEIEAVAGVKAWIPVRIESTAAPIAYRVYLDGVDALEGSLEPGGEAVARVAYTPRFLGVHRAALEVEVEDGAGLASLRLGPYIVTVRVSSRAARLAAAMEEVLAPILEAAGPPRIVLLRLAAPGAAGPGAAASAGYEGAGRGGGAPGPGGGPGIPAWLAEALQAGWGRGRGEYWGARLYVPGDRLRDIHWKKTASRRELYVKDYRAGGGEASGGGFRALIVDLLSSSPAELDSLAVAAYSILLGASGGPPVAFYLRLPDGSELAATGTAEEVLAFWHRILRSGALYTRLNYPSTGRPAVVEEHEGAPRPVGALLLALEESAQSIIERLKAAGAAPGSPVTIVNGRPTATLHAYLARRLEAEGYRVLHPGRVVRGRIARIPPGRRGASGGGA